MYLSSSAVAAPRRLPAAASVAEGPCAVAAGRPRAVIAIPARDEADRLPGCLAALAAQRNAAGRPFDFARVAVLVLANNCRDGTAAAARALAPALPFALQVAERLLPPRLAHAGGARRAALDAALGLLDPAGALLSTDADGRAAPGWLAAHLAALADGAEAVAGRYRADPLEWARLPAPLRAREAAEAGYAALLEEMAARLDPVPHDPWPRHGVHSGASLAVTAEAYRRIGGLPLVPAGEDRALFAALARVDARIRHAPEAEVTVSCRLHGRARGGMADTLRHRLGRLAAPVDARLEPAALAWRRALLRRGLRRLHAAGATLPAMGEVARLAHALGLMPARLREILAEQHFGAAWVALEVHAPALARCRPLRPEELPRQARLAQALVAGLRARDAVPGPGLAGPGPQRRRSRSSRYSAVRRPLSTAASGASAAMKPSAAASPVCG